KRRVSYCSSIIYLIQIIGMAAICSVACVQASAGKALRQQAQQFLLPLDRWTEEGGAFLPEPVNGGFRLGIPGNVARASWSMEVAWVGRFREPPLAASGTGESLPVRQGERMNRPLVTATGEGMALALNNAKGPEWEWGGLLAKTDVDTDRFPMVEVEVRRLS